MRNFATTGLFLALFAMLAAPAGQAQTIGTHNTGTLVFDAYDNGILGAGNSYTTPGASFNGDTGLFEGRFIVGASDSQISNAPPYVASEFVTVSTISALTPPFSTPFEEFDQGFEAAYDDSGAPNPLGLLVTQRSYSQTGTDYVVYEFEVTNTSGGDLSDLYIGAYMDWDVGAGGANYLSNLAGYDAGTQLLYVWDDSQPATSPYFGFAALMSGDTQPVTGYDDTSLEFTVTGNPTEADLWFGMTNLDPLATEVEDRRVTHGTGPYDIANSASIVVRFAVVAGEDEDDAIANAQAAQDAVFVAIEPGPDGLPGTHNLSDVYPNPFNPQARFTLEVAEAQNVRIALYDALGREVATLHNGTLAAGAAHSFEVDGAGLPSGVYLVRATGERFTETRQVTLMK